MLNWPRKSKVGPTSNATLFDPFAGTASIILAEKVDPSSAFRIGHYYRN